MSSRSSAVVESDAGTTSDRETVEAFARYCVDSGRNSVLPWLRRPLEAVRALGAARRLPPLEAALGGSGEAAIVRRELQRSWRTFTPLDTVSSVLVLPDSLEAWTGAPARATVRRKVRASQKLGTVCEPVDDVAERRALLARADERERTHPDAAYRYTAPQNGDLLDVDAWFVARSADGRPLVVAVIPVDGDWAVLRYFRTLVDGDEASAARWLLTVRVVQHLIEHGVHHLADTVSPFRLTNGLRHFQLMLGYSLFNVRVGAR